MYGEMDMRFWLEKAETEIRDLGTLDISSELVKPSRAPDLAPQRQRLLELGFDMWPRLRAPARRQHRAQDAVDAEPGMPEADVALGHFFNRTSS